MAGLLARTAPESDLDRFLDRVNAWSLRHGNPHTHQAYHQAVARLARALRELGREDLALHPQKIGPDEARAVARALGARYRPATVNATLSALSGLWQDWSRTGGPEENPWRGIPRRRPEVRVAHKILSRDEVAALLAGALDRPRLYGLLATLYYLGLRISEAIQLEWEDLFREGGGGRVWATVYGKRGRTRQVPVPDHVLAAWRQGNSKQEGVILLGPFGRPWTRHAAHHAIQRYALASGFPAISPHWLRHSAAAHLLEQGIAINKVQAWLGHANLATTSIYVRLGVSAEMADVL